MMRIEAGSQITLHFELRLLSGEVIDSTFNKEPATCVWGDGNFLPGFEAVLLGLIAGDKKTAVLPPEQAFGLHRSENIHHVPRAQFDPRLDIAVGLVMDFADGKANLPGVIREIQDDYVTVDFNHPLAGREIEFEVIIVDVTVPLTASIPVVQL